MNSRIFFSLHRRNLPSSHPGAACCIASFPDSWNWTHRSLLNWGREHNASIKSRPRASSCSSAEALPSKMIVSIVEEEICARARGIQRTSCTGSSGEVSGMSRMRRFRRFVLCSMVMFSMNSISWGASMKQRAVQQQIYTFVSRYLYTKRK